MSIPDIHLHFQRSSESAAIEVTLVTASSPRPFPYQISEKYLPKADIDQLRRMQASRELVVKLAHAVRELLLPTGPLWIVQNALDTLDKQHVEPFRIVLETDDVQLRGFIADLPVELISLADNSGQPRPLVARRSPPVSIVHRVPRGTPWQPPATNQLRILIVRANPADAGHGVPEALPLCDDLQGYVDALGRERVRVHLLTAEEHQGKPYKQGEPTYDELQRALEQNTYDAFVFLGHGDLDAEQGSVLLFEQATEPERGAVVRTPPLTEGRFRHEIRAAVLADLLREHPVPLVLLVSCLSSQSVVPEQRKQIDAGIEQWMQGTRGAALSLLEEHGGARAVVGMRYLLEKSVARPMLQAFFKSLLSIHPGDVERAVIRTRQELLNRASDPYEEPAWSAPVLFRYDDTEPLLPFLAASDPAKQNPHDELLLELHQRLQALFNLLLPTRPLELLPPAQSSRQWLLHQWRQLQAQQCGELGGIGGLFAVDRVAGPAQAELASSMLEELHKAVRALGEQIAAIHVLAPTLLRHPLHCLHTYHRLEAALDECLRAVSQATPKDTTEATLLWRSGVARSFDKLTRVLGEQVDALLA